MELSKSQQNMQTLLSMVLSIGNYLNGGTARGEVSLSWYFIFCFVLYFVLLFLCGLNISCLFVRAVYNLFVHVNKPLIFVSARTLSSF